MLARIIAISCLVLLLPAPARTQNCPRGTNCDQPPQTKRIYFFRDNMVWTYDPRAGTDRVIDGPHPIARKFHALKPPFTGGVDAAINWGNGFVYFFKNDLYWKYDVFLDRAATPDPVRIEDGWTDFPPDFKRGIDAAFNGGEGKAYFFRGGQYLRYNIKDEAVDRPDPGTEPYPRPIAGPNGWRNLPSSFASGIDAAVNTGNGKIYFFKGSMYVRITFATRTMDQVSPPYPYAVASSWPGLPANVRTGVEWSQAGSATLSQNFHSPCQGSATSLLTGDIGRIFTVDAQFTQPHYPALCGCAEYRQYVRGSHTLNGVAKQSPLPDPHGGPPRPMLPIPPSGEGNFLEDGNVGTPRFYGHRALPPDKFARFTPDQRTGCQYRMVDRPFQQGMPGQTAGFDLDFKGVVIDVCNGGEVIAQTRWRATCSAQIPAQ